MEVFLFSMDSLPWENQPLGFIKKNALAIFRQALGNISMLLCFLYADNILFPYLY